MSVKPPRAYLLIEAMIAGVVVAVALLAALDFAAKARADTSAAGIERTAMSLARAQAETIASALPAGIADQAAFAPVAGVPGLDMKWTTTTDSTLGTNSTPNITATVEQINVTVRYSVPIGSAEDLRAPPKDGLAEVSVHRTWIQ